jgi:hypothetical protein
VALVSLVGATRAPPCCHREALRLNSMAEQRGRLLDKKKEKQRAQNVSTWGSQAGGGDVRNSSDNQYMGCNDEKPEPVRARAIRHHDCTTTPRGTRHKPIGL